MYIFDIENKTVLKDVLLDNLKILGVRCRPPKKIKENEKENVYSENQTFQKPLHLLKKCVTQRLDGSDVEVPEFLADACSVIEKDITVEGIFRKAGSTCKQRERKLELNQGKKVSCQYHVLDACSLVKLFFRELPQPIIPFGYHEIFLKCLLLSTYEKELDALLLASMLLPEENISTLAFFMEFLWKVSQHAEKNKMNVKNLAIILTPTIMPVYKGTRVSNSLEMASHFKVMEMLIENAVRIGKVPDHIIESIISISSKKQKKKRRSGSITRMFTGLRKIVGKGSEWEDEPIATPESVSSSLGKRKNAETNSKLNLSAKKKRSTDSSPIATPLRCRMQGYATSLNLVPSCASSIGKRNCTRSPADKSVTDRDSSDMRSSRLNLVRRCTTKRQKSKKKLASTTDLGNVETEKPSLERKLSLVSWGLGRTSLFASRHEADSHRHEEEEEEEVEESPEKSVDLSDSEFITVPKSEYEDIKNRVSALEEDLEKLATVHSVQTAFERTLEEAEKLSDGGPSAEQLARRLSRELNIRRSCEGKIMRSPSARKIGSIRRRSKELTSQRNSEPKSSLKRGRPNTVQTGLPSPRLRALGDESLASAKKMTRSATFREGKEEWRSGEIFFSNLTRRLTPTPQGRPSLAEIRSHNAGMVLEKAKLFNSLNESNDPGRRRRQSVRVENLRRRNEAVVAVTRARSFGSERKPKLSPGAFPPRGSGEDAFTPKCQRPHARRDTPSIKKPLVTRSPRSFSKTPQVRSSQRSRATPMKALMEAGATPHIGPRRSPRILARTMNTPNRPRD